ncbi:hypothetical protein CapIbe_009786 [Capra ibex]
MLRGPKDQPRPPWKSREGAGAGAQGDVWKGAHGPSSPSRCLLPWAAPGHRSPEALRSWGGRPGGPVPHLRLVPTETGRPNTATVDGEGGQSDRGERGVDRRPRGSGPRCLPERELPQRSGPDLGLLIPAPSCFPGSPELQTQSV